MGAPLAEQDLKTLFLRHARQLQSYLLRKTRDSYLTTDLAQENFLRLAEQRHKEPIERVDTCLYRTAHNLTIDHYRQERRRRTEIRPNDDLIGPVADQPGPGESTVDADAPAHLREVVIELPPHTYEIFHLNRLGGLTHVEVARRLEISDSSAQKRLACALAHVMQALEDSRWVDYRVLPVRASRPQ